MSFLWNTKNTDRIGVNEQNRHTTHKEKDNFRKGKLMLVIAPILGQPPIFPTRIFMGKFWTHPFLRKFRKLNPLFFCMWYKKVLK